MRNLIDQTDEQIIARFNHIFDQQIIDSVEDLVFTKDSVDDFLNALSGYAKKGEITTDHSLRNPFEIAFSAHGVQVKKVSNIKICMFLTSATFAQPLFIEVIILLG